MLTYIVENGIIEINKICGEIFWICNICKIATKKEYSHLSYVSSKCRFHWMNCFIIIILFRFSLILKNVDFPVLLYLFHLIVLRINDNLENFLDKVFVFSNSHILESVKIKMQLHFYSASCRYLQNYDFFWSAIFNLLIEAIWDIVI